MDIVVELSHCRDAFRVVKLSDFPKKAFNWVDNLSPTVTDAELRRFRSTCVLELKHLREGRIRPWDRLALVGAIRLTESALRLGMYRVSVDWYEVAAYKIWMERQGRIPL